MIDNIKLHISNNEYYLLNKLNKNVKEKDFSDAYIIKLKNFNYKKYNLNFNFEDIFNKLPKKIFSSEYLGDLTLENILYDVDKNKFFYKNTIRIRDRRVFYKLAGTTNVQERLQFIINNDQLISRYNVFALQKA